METNEETSTSALDIYDPINDKTYRLFVTKEDYNRAHSDPTFAQSLLSHATKCDGEKENITEENNNTDKFDDISPKENTRNVPHKFIWSHAETIALLHSMEKHLEHLSHPVKRKHVFENVGNDLLSLGYSIDATTCNTKWKTLVRSYKNTKDNNTKTGRSSSRFLFFEKMDEILDNSMQSPASTNESIDEVEEGIIEGQNVHTDNVNENNKAHTKQEKLCKKRSINDIYKLKQEEYNKRQKRHEERMKIQQEKLELYKKKN
ncbi:myb/sant-like dna-binding domain [Holotrichia oblita]|uniref:Myb/sant-like dna-binding domain n=1 Tax=Holotrichia oblita TaxID=644536 RepID=A0ACB9SI46_HOLOL|nr:myb/sant-like dna-binding domain [Holotrichia oblita]